MSRTRIVHAEAILDGPPEDIHLRQYDDGVIVLGAAALSIHLTNTSPETVFRAASLLADAAAILMARRDAKQVAA